MTSLMIYLAKNGPEIWQALGQHLTLSLIATVITIILAIPLAIALIDHRRAGEFVLQVASVIQTIPSLAILGLLIPLVGIGPVPAVIALVLYAVMPVFSNTYAGLTNIDPLLLEAADAFGVSRRYKLFKIQIPLALPLILTGLRIAVVMIVGTATLAALIGGGGLGTYILLGIQTNNNNALLVGAVLAAVLALLASAAIRWLAHARWRHLLIGGIILLLAGGGFYGWQKWQAVQQETITIAGKMGSEPEILLNLYKELIEKDQPRIKVQLKPNFGGTSFLFNGLQSKKIDLYPEFTGTVLQSLVQTKEKMPHQPQVAYHLAQKLLAQQQQLTLLAPMQYQNGYMMTVRQETAQRYHLKTIADLQRTPQLRAAFDPDFYQQADGYPGLQRAYGLKFQAVRTMEPALRYEALARGKIEVTDGYTTDPQIKKYNLVVLRDNQRFFPPYQGAPLMRRQFAQQHPQIVRSLNRLQGRVTTAQMQAMNYAVTVKHEKAATVAHRFLLEQGLLPAQK
ncbi:ABC transporter permease/substrate-binding protein [Lactobacillus sp. DCY120]|uniref:ABC transporter permease/substrate-binding protein n=1 Tax=Bombilactobacillus apium TaxID=2675299 RepID=A0A850R1A5_9LACO|nr:ABC transporter permease/substrate-binding protein [Bombilactobacillus apium]NVY96140.1 ABC transporter permease/substrate-binding protein [Bombilactobacillus apium]